MNQLILGDCLQVLKKIESNSVDLIYLDPPFFSNRNYEVIWGDTGEIRSFEDRWSGGIDHYIAWLKERVLELHRILKPTGSIFLHCDWHANAYIRVLILDKIFGEQNFRNEIIWQRSFGTGSSKSLAKKIPVNIDTIFWYAKNGDNLTFNLQIRAINEGALKRYDKVDESGKRFFWADMKTYSDEKLQRLLASGEAKISPTAKNPRYKKYLDESIGTPIDTLWNDFAFIGKNERIGYPTQKPEALLERIIQCASNEGDIVLDPFLGGGTTIAVADRLKRNWIGIDQSVAAIKVSELRLNKQRDLFSIPFTVQLHKYDYDTLRNNNAFEFETWIIQQYGGIPNTKQRSDLGIDGRDKTGIPIQVKRSDNIGRNVIDNFVSACKRYDKNLFENNLQANKSVGIIIAFSFGKGAIQEVARLKNEENIIIQLITVESFVAISKKPGLTVNYNDIGINEKQLHTIEFTAIGTSESGIEFYTWDWNYNATEGFKSAIVRDKDGKQTQTFKVGTSHCIAVKVIDNDGLEHTEVLSIKVN